MYIYILYIYIHIVYILLNFRRDKHDFLKRKSYHKTKMIQNKLLYVHTLSISDK